jgi:hypothetical protein
VSGQGLPPAGWYREPSDPTQERLWDGTEWRRWVRPYLEGRVEPNPAGWYLNPWLSEQEHLWTGEMWSGLTRPSEGTGPRLRRLAAAAAPRVHTGMRYSDPNPPVSVLNLGNWTCLALVLTILVSVATLVFRQIYLGRVSDLVDGHLISIHQLETAIDNLNAVGYISGGVGLVTTILFIVWFHRAYRNLIRFGIDDVRYGPGWAVGGWFIPIFNLFRQKAIANDIWKGSASAAAGDSSDWRAAPLSNLVNWWWGVWIASATIGFAGFHRPETLASLESATISSLRDYRVSLWIWQGTGLIGIAAAVLAILYVRRVSRMQEEATEGWDETAPTGSKTCPECAEQVRAVARVCRFCGHRFEEPVGVGSDGGPA